MNEDPSAASSDAPAGASAPSSAPTPPADTRTASRFYSRMGRGHSKPAAASAGPGASSEPVSLDSLTAEQAALLKDNLPVRATAAPGTEATEFGGPRGDRPPREGGFDRERRGRGRDRDRGERGERGEGDDRGRGRGRGRGRDRDRDRDGGRDRGHGHNDGGAGGEPEAGRTLRFDDEPAGSVDEPTYEAPAAAAESAAPEAPAPTPAPAPEAPRKLRFEDAPTHETQRTVQEFRPSHDRDFNRDAERARAEREKRESTPAEKGSGLFGWMKSIFTPKPEDGGAPAEESAERPRGGGQRDRDRQRGPRGGQGHGQGGGQPQGDGQGHGGGEHGGRRRRRRRGGRNRNRNRDGGHGGGDQGVSGGGGY